MRNWLWLLTLCGCAAFSRDCSSCTASNFGSDWIVVQYNYNVTPINCWMLRNTAITNETQTDGIYWKSSDGHLVHISGWYNRAQVNNGDWKGAVHQLNVDYDGCTEGAYRIQDAGLERKD